MNFFDNLLLLFCAIAAVGFLAVVQKVAIANITEYLLPLIESILTIFRTRKWAVFLLRWIMPFLICVTVVVSDTCTRSDHRIL